MEATVRMGKLAVNPIGGLGNQLFIIAHGYKLAREQGRELVIDTFKWGANQGEHINNYKDNIFKNFTFGKGENIPIGYYQGEKYFEPYGREFVNKLSLNITKIERVAVHIRRGDYVGSNYQVCDDDYYKRAIDMFDMEMTIFTDDPVYCEKFGLPIFSGTTLQAFENMACHSVVICSNSSFSWWASYIGQSIAVVPKKWYLDKTDNDVYRKDMVKI